MPTTNLPSAPASTAASGSPGHRATVWDRLAVLLLGAAGCLLSYDALRQMAFAIHVRPALTWLFPVVIDGFIAYGVRALLVLRTTPLGARLYTWALFATATTASIWANALHAIRLNQLPHPAVELRLGDATVGVLSTLAPLALAGATHLHILITRHSDPTVSATPVPVPASAPAPASTAGRDLAPTAYRVVGEDGEPEPVHESAPGLESEADSRHRPQSGLHDATATAALTTAVGAGDVAGRSRRGRPPGGSIEDLLTIARAAVSAHGGLSRRAVAQEIRAAGLTIGDKRLTELMTLLREEFDQAGQ
ncbi:hypothetical protein ABIA32_000319 [Streptacidiphilus sp. MAP12-20]|uniref:DUF2637 domain-containing protein n=1 Tax=Streptacidiphilus sp. MAP12-20 TaxID=3156299 RepID=UPI00351332DD